MSKEWFRSDCRACPRLARFLQQNAQRYPDYHNAPVAPFGDPRAHLLVVGLAPGLHGANASGRPFTGDFAGILLYETLYAHGLCSAPRSVDAGDGLRMIDCRISNAVKCVPPQNKPTGDEVMRCNAFLRNEIESLKSGSVILALGAIAHRAVLKTLELKLSAYSFGHARTHSLGKGLTLVDSYHCSRYNTQTGRLTSDMFNNVVGLAKGLVKRAERRRRSGEPV